MNVLLFGLGGFVGAAIAICSLLALRAALAQCQPRNRTMEPDMVWLNLIPIFNLIWCFYTVVHVSNSLRNEFIDREVYEQTDYGKGLGIAACFMGLIGPFHIGLQTVQGNLAFHGRIQNTEIIYLMCALPALVGFGLFVAYWVKVVGCRRRLIELNFRGNDRGMDDDYDDEPRRNW